MARSGGDGRGHFDATLEWPPHPRRLLTAHAVFDANVPVSLACDNRTQILREAFAGRAHVPDRVRGEIMGLAEGDARIRALFHPDWFAEVHPTFDRDGRQRVLDRQVAWKGRDRVAADPHLGRGEAECLELAAQHAGWVVVSQDSDAISHGRKRRPAIPVFALPDVLVVVAVQGRCLPESAWRIYERIGGADVRAVSRYWPLDEATKERFLALCAQLKADP